MKSLMFVCLLTLSLMCLGNEERTTLETLYPSVVKITTPGGGVGTGFVFRVQEREDGSYLHYILTAKHVVTHNPKGILVDGLSPSLVMEHKTKDLAIIFLKTDKYTVPYTLASEMPRIGTRCALIGYPLGVELFINEGLYLGDADEDSTLIKSNVSSINGMSGGPLLCNGKVVGVLFGGYKRGDHPIPFMTYLTKVDDIDEQI